MQTFIDSKGRGWTIDLTVGCLRRVKALIGVDLIAPEASVDELGKPIADPTEPVTLSHRVCSDLMLFVDVLFAAVGEQAKAMAIDIDAFCETLPPALCREARSKFLQEWEDFFRSLGRDDQAAVVRAASDLVSELQTQSVQATQRLATVASLEMTKQINAETEKAIAELTSGTSSTNSPGSSG